MSGLWNAREEKRKRGETGPSREEAQADWKTCRKARFKIREMSVGQAKGLENSKAQESERMTEIKEMIERISVASTFRSRTAGRNPQIRGWADRVKARSSPKE
jgi:hypothetical protein